MSQDRLCLSGLSLLALPIAVASVPWTHKAIETWLELRPWAHLTLEAALNLLWLLLAMASLVHWASAECRGRHAQTVRLVSLVFAFALLFPVISANDDLAEFELINDAGTAQAVAANLKMLKATPTAPLQGDAAAPSGSRSGFPLPFAFGSVFTPAAAPSVTTPSGATGIHSPPLRLT